MSDREEAAAEPRAKKPAAPEAPARPVIEWAAAKGHMPVKKRVVFRGDAIHRGPHIRVIRQHNRWPENLMVTEAQYDAGVAAAYSIEMRER